MPAGFFVLYTSKTAMTFLALFGFLNMTIADILDILLVAVIIYLVFRWIRGTSAMSIFVAILSLYVIRVTVAALNMKLMTTMMKTVLDVGVLALIVIFQPEIRRALISLGNRYRNVSSPLLKKVLNLGEKKIGTSVVQEVTEACRSMAESRTGALIVFPYSNSLEDIEETGDKVDSIVNRRIIMNLFFKNSPLHDGAVIIDNGRVAAARCTLPVTERTDIPASYGMRHKAAIGLTEQTDAGVIVVSEETGRITWFRGGNSTAIGNINELKLILDSDYSGRQGD